MEDSELPFPIWSPPAEARHPFGSRRRQNSSELDPVSVADQGRTVRARSAPASATGYPGSRIRATAFS